MCAAPYNTRLAKNRTEKLDSAAGKSPVGGSWIKLNLVSLFWGHRPRLGVIG
jgi:hypothetical protein